MAWVSTTDHAAGSYGQPVLVDTDTGIAYGPADLLTTNKAAAVLGITDRHVRRLMARQGIGTRLTDRMTVLTVDQAESLRSLLKPGRGRPTKGELIEQAVRTRDPDAPQPRTLREMRQRLGLTQVQFAARLNAEIPGLHADQHQVTRWERAGQSPHPAVIEIVRRMLAASDAGRADRLIG